MIIFATSYDDATLGGYVVARLIPNRAFPPETSILLERDAVGAPLKQALQSLPNSLLLAFSHGKKTHLCGQGGSPAIEPIDGETIGSRPVFAYACWTADGLGEQIAQYGAIWWGFTGEIAGLPTDHRSAQILAKVFAELIQHLPHATTPGRINQFIVHIRKLCNAAKADLAALHRTGHRVDPYAYYSIEHILKRLRVWVKGQHLPLYDPENNTPISVEGL